MKLFGVSVCQLIAAMAVLFSWLALAVAAVSATSIVPRANSSDPLASCPGYKALNIKTTSSSLTADLSLAGTACNAYGDDLKSLTLQVVYETGSFLSSLNGFDGFDRILQMIEFTSKFKILPTTYIRSPKAFFHVLLRLTA